MGNKIKSGFEELAAVCCYFNPAHYQSRRNNYDVFAAGIKKVGLNLTTVELAFGEDPFELPASEGLIQIRTKHIMWQKERLLNIAIKSLPAKFSKVAWLDCDILFDTTDWPERLSRLLDSCVFVQCWKDFVLLPADHTKPGSNVAKKFGAVYYYLETGRFERGHTGFAWAARRELLDKHGLYDANILGAADVSMCFGLYGSQNLLGWTKEMSCWGLFRSMNTGITQHLENWLIPFANDIKDKVGYLDETVYPMFHGNLSDRFYGERSRILKHFDPFQDIKIGTNQCWYWSNNKIDLQQNVKDYFNIRSEDKK